MPSPELDYITIKGFKSFASLEKLPLRPINVIIGPNGSGKSNFIGAFSLLSAICDGKLQDYIRKAGGAEKILHFGSKSTDHIYFHLSFRNEMNSYRIRLFPSAGDTLTVFTETVSSLNKQSDPERTNTKPLVPHGLEARISSPNIEGIAADVLERLAGWRVCHFNDTSPTSPMKKTASVNDNRFLRPDGSNLSAFLYFLREMHKDTYELIRKSVQRVAPFFDDFILEPLQLKPDTILLEWRHKGSEAYFDASMLSDGTLRFIALATLFLQPEDLRPSVILVDEPELGLHPYSITMLASLIKQAAVKIQVIVGTQSPLLLDHFAPEDVLVANRAGGHTELRRLETAGLTSWLEDYSLGQLWEKNELGGRPASE